MNVMYEIQEEHDERDDRDDREEDINTQRNLAVFERLPTEYGEEEEELDYEIIAKELSKYIETSLSLLFVLILLEFIIIFNADLVIALTPMFLLDFKRLLLQTFRLKNYQSFADSNITKVSSAKNIIQSLGNLTFYSMLIMCYYNPGFLLMFTIIPLILSSFAGFLIKIKATNQCQLFSIICMTIGDWVKILIFLNVGLKIDGFVKMDWIVTMWPLWMVLTCITILSTGALLLVFVSICSYYYKESPITEIYSSVWMFYTTAMGSLTISFMSHDAFRSNYHRMCITGIVYLGVFIVFTQIIKVHLLKWWRSFFVHHEQITIPNSLSNSGPLPLPPSQAEFMRFPTKIIRAIKLPPKALVRMSSTYFQPANIGAEPIRSARTMSQDIKKTMGRENIHYRSLSTVPREPESIIKKSLTDLAFPDKKCRICYEGECNSVYMPCGHGGICLNCAIIVMKGKGSCCICRTTIEQVLKIKVGPGRMMNVVGTNSNVNQ